MFMFAPYTGFGGQAMVGDVHESDRGQNGKMPDLKPADQEKFQDSVQEEPGGMMCMFTFVLEKHNSMYCEKFGCISHILPNFSGILLRNFKLFL